MCYRNLLENTCVGPRLRTSCSNTRVVTKEFSKLLSSPEENSFDLDIVGRVSFLRSNFADKIFMSYQRYVSSLNMSFSTNCHLLGILFITILKSVMCPLSAGRTQRKITTITHAHKTYVQLIPTYLQKEYIR